MKVSEVVMEGVKPDAVILLDISPETSIKRRAAETNGDPFDKQNEDYFRRLIAGYREMAQEGWGGLKWYMVNGEGTIEEVQVRISEVLTQIFEKV